MLVNTLAPQLGRCPRHSLAQELWSLTHMVRKIEESGNCLLQQLGDRLIGREEETVVDRYTKGALTAIALSLSIIAVQNAVGTSAAQQTPMKVQICDDLLHCVQLTPVAPDRYALPTLSTPAVRLLQSK